MRFTEIVVRDIARGNFEIVDGIMGPDYICCSNTAQKWDASATGRTFFEGDATGPDDWALGYNGSIFGLRKRVWLRRGPERFFLKLHPLEHRALADIFQAIFEEKKELAKAEKNRRKLNREAAYWA